MIEMRHAGIYVEDLPRMETFYQNVFSMKVILSKVRTSDILIDAIVGAGKAVLISKLITPRGCETGSGDMVELLQVEKEAAPPDPGPVFQTGTAHLGFGVDDMERTVQAIQQNGGCRKTDILQMGSNLCCFCTDPEGNWLELIQRKAR